jgi:hypothetical protein
MSKAYLFLALLIFGISKAQEKTFESPNYKAIEKNIKDKKSDFYYPKLMSRYELSDTTMTLEQKRHLYYGYTFQPKYNPYGRSDSSEKLLEIINKETLSEEDYNAIIKLSNQALKDNPLDIRSLNYRLYSLEKQQKLEELKQNLIKLETIVDAMVSSGDGISKETAFYIIEISHEYDLLGMFGFKYGGKQSLIEHYDYLSVAQNDENIKGLYFDVTPALDFLAKKK